jgi:hypothetical protein
VDLMNTRLSINPVRHSSHVLAHEAQVSNDVRVLAGTLTSSATFATRKTPLARSAYQSQHFVSRQLSVVSGSAGVSQPVHETEAQLTTHHQQLTNRKQYTMTNHARHAILAGQNRTFPSGFVQSSQSWVVAHWSDGRHRQFRTYDAQEQAIDKHRKQIISDHNPHVTETRERSRTCRLG